MSEKLSRRPIASWMSSAICLVSAMLVQSTFTLSGVMVRRPHMLRSGVPRGHGQPEGLKVARSHPGPQAFLIVSMVLVMSEVGSRSRRLMVRATDSGITSASPLRSRFSTTRRSRGAGRRSSYSRAGLQAGTKVLCTVRVTTVSRSLTSVARTRKELAPGASGTMARKVAKLLLEVAGR